MIKFQVPYVPHCTTVQKIVLMIFFFTGLPLSQFEEMFSHCAMTVFRIKARVSKMDTSSEFGPCHTEKPC